MPRNPKLKDLGTQFFYTVVLLQMFTFYEGTTQMLWGHL